MIKLRINPKAYDIALDSTPIEVQEFDSRIIKVFYLNEFDVLMEEFINKGKFAVWSSVDGVNYHLYVEEGYYNELKELYGQPINKIWVDFWDNCEALTKKASTRIIIPGTIVAVALCLLCSFLPESVSLYATIAVVAIAFIGMLTVNRWTKKKIYDENVKSVDLIKKELGSKNFEKLLEKQKNYMDNYYDSLYPDEEEETEAEVVEEVKEITTEEKEEVSE